MIRFYLLFCGIHLALFTTAQSYPVAFSDGITFTDVDMSAVIDDCAGTLTVDIKVLYEGNGAQGGFEDFEINIKRGDGSEESIFRMQRGFVGSGNYPPSFVGGRIGHIDVGNIYAYRLRYYIRSSSANNVSVLSINEATSDRHALRLVFDNLPADLFGQTYSVSLGGNNWYQVIDGNGSRRYSNSKTISVSQAGVESPSYSLSTVQDESCDHVKLTWVKPTTVAGCATKNYMEVYRRQGSSSGFQYLDSVRFDHGNSYHDTGASKGVDYEYQIRHAFYPNAFRADFAPFSSILSGRRLGRLAVPTDFSATDDDCMGQTVLSWSWPYSSTQLRDFLIQRREKGAQDWEDVGYPSKTATSYDDDSAIPNVIYEYRIFSRNVCSTPDLSLSSAVVEGMTPGDPIEPVVDSVVQINEGFEIHWTTPANDINTGYVIERTFPGGGSPFIIDEIPLAATSHIDTDVAECVTYTYRVKAISVCFPQGKGNNAGSGIITPDLSNSFSTDGQGFRASKGYYSDKVELQWLNQNESLTNTVKVFRRVLGSGEPFTLLTTLNGGSGIYNDQSANAGELYEYEIVAEGPCENTAVESNRVRSIGFRRKTGIINGNVSYEGGIAVENVKIIASDPSDVSFPSLKFELSDTAIVEHTAALELGAEIIVESWIKPDDLNQSFSIAQKEGSFDMEYNHGAAHFRFSVTTSTGVHEVSLHQDSIGNSDWVHVAGSLSDGQIQLLVDGVVKASNSVAVAVDIIDTEYPILIGLGLNGKIKEFRLWNVGKDSIRFAQDYSRFLAGNEAGLLVYLNAGEGRGDYAYDLSRSGPFFNKHHARLSDPQMWDLIDSPSTDQLSISAYTDQNGNYNMVIPYGGVGQNFVITPIYNIHQFDPSTKSVFIGDGNPIENGVDFTDISAFKVAGQVFFENTNCPSRDVFVKVDGEVVIENGIPVMTDATGFFEMDVPIGRHVITLEKNGHVFSSGRFPSDGTQDFQAPVSGIEFVDGTLRTVIGRVVGGTREEDKVPGLGRSKNNIGIANLTFDPSLTCGWIIDEENGITSPDTSLSTDSLTGEYRIELPPLEYNVLDVTIKNNSGIDLGPSQVLDLTNIVFGQTVVDTVFQEGTDNVVSIDEVSFHEQLDFIYRVGPSIDVTDVHGGPFIGDDEILFSHSSFGSDTIPVSSLSLLYPVFIQGATYKARISTFEEYVNLDSEIELIDRVPVTDGILTINNELSAGDQVQIDLSDDPIFNGDTVLTFIAGEANIAENITIPDYSFTKEFKIDLQVGAFSTSWEPIEGPVPPGGNSFYRAYIMGAKDIEQSDFATQGPDMVSYILRDPPGSQSSATRSIGTSVISVTSWEWNVGGDVSFNKGVYGGLEFQSGIGYIVPSKVKADINIGIEAQVAGSEGRSVTETMTNLSEWSTSDDPLLAGSESDLFIGSSRNYLFGSVTSLTVVPATVCGSSTSFTCFDVLDNGYRLAIEQSLSVAKGDVNTSFVFTRNKIETDEIPDLIRLRNEYLSNNPAYQSNLDIDHPCFGLNNDDPLFDEDTECPNTLSPTADPDRFQVEDLDGPSYTYTKPTPQSIDSVRIFNQQIRLWTEALKRDEQQKAQARNAVNYSYGGGGASFTNTSSTSSIVEEHTTIEFQITEKLTTLFGFSSGGVGFDNELAISLTEGRTQTNSDIIENNYDISYTISDDSEWDDFSFDVYPHSISGGPIFKTIAGRTSCPWEGPVYSKYYSPGTLLNPGTIQLEQPQISISPSVLYNVPQDATAVFTMTLTNNNTVGEGWEYATKLIPETNPNSLSVNVGSSDDLTRTWVIPAQSSITRDIFVEIGNAYAYEGLQVAMHSTCQFQQGLSEEEDIVDYAEFSVYFVPECTDIALSHPEDNWVLNSAFDNTLDIVVADYNINHLNLDHLSIQYKASNNNNWFELEKYYYDTTGMNDPEALQIDRSSPQSAYSWDVNQIPDGAYDLRALTDCTVASTTSPVYSGYMDRINPHAFGAPSPADGILDPDEDLLIRFNESIDIGTVSDFNIDVRGVLNGTPLRNQESLAFDGQDDYGEIPEYQLQKRSFTFETWVKRYTFGEQVIISQGQSAQDLMAFGFAAGDQLFLQLGSITAQSDMSISDTDWHHVAVSYDRESERVSFYIDNQLSGARSSFVTDYTADGALFVGRTAADLIPKLGGQLSELRLWSISRTLSEIAPRSGIILSGREEGLVGNWSLSEAIGSRADDKVRSRHMQIFGATWAIAPESHSFEFSGNNYLKASNTGSLSISDEADLTFEGWIKTDRTKRMTILSNGIPSADHPFFWHIGLNSLGQLEVLNNDTGVYSSTLLNDNDWHHFAIVIERTRAVTLYIDGQVERTANAADFGSFGGPAFYVGASGFFISGVETIDDEFDGAIDDIRIWNVARQADQIKRDFNNQLLGDEPGLMAYYPFDEYTLDLGVYSLTQSLNDAAEEGYDLSAVRGGAFSTNSPKIRLPRPVEKVNFNFSINEDEIYIEPTDEAARLENITLDITVKGIRDRAGNFMESPETWIAYIDQNQTFWETEYYQFDKAFEESLSFNAVIQNTGGRQEQYTISNIPAWMTVSPTAGIIQPNSEVIIEVSIDPLLNIGKYEQDLYVSTESFGYNERLLIDLNVLADPPEWSVDYTHYSYSMSLIGELFINDIISADESDMVSVWVGEEIRGVAPVSYDPASGKHLVFMSIMSNEPFGDTLVFRAWDASLGRVLTDVSPYEMLFASNDVKGSKGFPIPVKAKLLTQLEYILYPGWNWISFPIFSDHLDDIDHILQDLSPHDGDEVKSQTAFQVHYDEWMGDLSGFDTDRGFKIKVAERDTFSYEGIFNNPTNEPITIKAGWNWIGFKSLTTMNIETALASLDPQTGDLIKGKNGFAIYDELFGWGGNLKTLEPLQSYMLQYHKDDLLIYPNSSPLGNAVPIADLKEQIDQYIQQSMNGFLISNTNN